jgi:glycosyltransferase involved in cell wall biosynthesis
MVHGYEHLAKWLAFSAARSCGTRLILRGESTLISPRTALKRAAKRAILGSVLRRFSAVTYIGESNREYFESYGVDPARLHFAPYSVDNEFFARESERLRPKRAELRRALGIGDDAPVIVSIAKLTSVKQPDLLLGAYARLRSRFKCHLLFVGGGNLRSRIEETVVRKGISDVHMAGFINQSRIPEMHACGDILALPSLHEPWGLAVNEAMASGLPAVVSDRVGCAADLVRDGVTGFTFRHDSEQGLAERLEALVADGSLRARMGENARKRVEGWSIARTGDGILSAVRQCISNAGTDAEDSSTGEVFTR